MSITHIRTFARSQNKEVKRFIKFATVGVLGSVTDFSVLNILVQLFGLQLGTANLISVICAILQNFALNRLWTFPESRERNAQKQLGQFVTVSLIGLGINQVVFITLNYLLEPFWHNLLGDPALSFTVSYNFAKLFSIGVVLFWNFLANRFWTYRGL